MDNCLFAVEKVMTVTGYGADINNAAENAFLNMRKEINITFNQPIISINATKVNNLGIEKNEKEEAFLYLFFKRKVITYKIKLEIYLVINFLKLEG